MSSQQGDPLRVPSVIEFVDAPYSAAFLRFVHCLMFFATSAIHAGDAVAPSDEASTVKQNSPAAGTGAAGTNYMRDAGYDTGTSTQGYMATQKPFSTGEGYMTAPAGDGSGYGDQNPGSGHNTGIGATGAGTGDTGYRHGAGELATVLGNPVSTGL